MYKLLSILFLYLPTFCFAGTVGDYTLVKNETWNKTEGYTINGTVVIPKGMTLKLNSTNINLNAGSIYVYGTLEISGGLVTSGIFDGVFNIGGSMLFSDVAFENCPKIMTWGKASLVIARSKFSSCISSSPLIAVWDSSLISISDSSFVHNKTSSLIDAYNGSSISIENSDFRNNQSGRIVQIYGQKTVLQVQNSQFVESINSVGVEVFNSATAYIDSSIFSDIKTGILSYGEAELVISKNIFAKNNIGIEMYNASTTIGENSFEEHTEYAVLASGGNIDARNNWWADSTGPKYILQNLSGKGEVLDGSMSVYPWLLEKPNIEKCCSSVLFFPGIQGSRLYTRGYMFENQLWEPNRDKDVQKLFFSESGESVSKSIYIKDIIERTNIGSGIGLGTLDSNIYKDFVDFMGSLKKKGSIKSFEVVPYDWRYSTYELMNLNKTLWKNKFLDMVNQSKTKKVTLIGHSFGGILVTRFAEYLEEQGLGNYIDSIVLVGTPEQGSFSVVQALLHGDGQSLGKGYLLSQQTARLLTKNITSTYELLEKSLNSKWFTQVIDFKPKKGMQIFNSNNNIDSVEYFKDFIFKRNLFSSRSVPRTDYDISIPIKTNEYVYYLYRNNVHFKVSDTIQSKIYNILGTNNLTPVGTEYSHICSTEYGLFFLSGLKVSNKVIADEYCAVERKTKFINTGDGIVPLGDTDIRLGKKIYIDFKKYRDIHPYEITHSNLISAEPTISLIKEILFKRKLSYAAAPYITLPDLELVTENVQKYWRVRVLGKGKVHIETNTGAAEDFDVKEGYMEKNTIAGLQYDVVAGNRYILLPAEPKKIEVIANDFGYSNITVDTITEQNGMYKTTPNQPVYFYPTIPVVPKTVTTIEFSREDSVLLVDNNGDSVVDESRTPHVSTTTEGEFVRLYTKEEIIIELNKLKADISKSEIRKKFKERYVLKVEALIRRIKNYNIKNPQQYSGSVTKSLESIIVEIKTGYKNYKGGLYIGEASVLHIGFGKIYIMFLNLK